jgi:molybdenum cofactor sulfurtransferase
MPQAVSHESRGRAAAEQDFLRRFPSYAGTAALDALRAADYERLDRCGCTYLDYTGGGLFGESQVRRHHDLLRERVLGNPHSQNPASSASMTLVEDARAAVRRFFNAPEDEYDVIFTANATGALKLVGEAYPFAPGGRYLMSYDNHNSVNGIREFAHRGGATVDYLPVRRSDLRLDEDLLRCALSPPAAGAARLFAYPAQSNFSGVQHPLEWVAQAQELGWDVLLDCAAYAPTNALDLHAVGADFAVLSFYKLFGYPTGIGTLIARRNALARLSRPWFAGGTIAFASVQADAGYRLTPGASGFEDGTIDYLGLPAVTIGLQHLESVGMELIHTRANTLVAWLLEELALLRHGNGAPLVRVFGPPDAEQRGAIVALHLLDPDGRPYDVYEVENAAGREGIATRTGCFCNPGDGEVAHDISREDMERCFRDSRRLTTLVECQRVIEDATGKVPNTLRVSLGLVSNFADVHRFVGFTKTYLDRAR